MAVSRAMKHKKEKEDKKKTDLDGVEVTIIKPGDACNFPKLHDSIAMHYKAFLEDGTIFDDSYTRRQPLFFVLGAGQVIKGLELFLLSGAISKGEKAHLVIPPELAYGEKGYPPIIPPLSKVVYEVELVSFSAYGVAERERHIRDV